MSSPPLPAARASSLAHAAALAASARRRLLRAYPSDWRSPGPTLRGSPPLQAWAESFYRRPHPELLRGALLELLHTPGAGVGAASLPAAVFFAEVARRDVRRPEDGAALLSDVMVGAQQVSAQHGSSGEGTGGGAAAAAAVAAALADEVVEKTDTVLRSLWLANTPACDAVLGEAAAQWSEDLGHETGGGAGTGAAANAGLAALGRSLFPPETQRHRAHITQWPLPALNLSRFERDLAQHEFPVYGCTRFWFMHTHAIFTFARAGGATAGRIGLMSPGLAQDLTISMVDALWACFYATGSSAAVLRVLDVATLYAEFLDEFDERFLVPDPAAPAPEGAPLLPPAPAELLDDPLALMRFEASRHALHSLLRHAAAHVAVGECVLRQFDQLDARSGLADADPLTSFGVRRLGLLRRLHPTLAQLAEHAKKEGVGSGKWPPSMAALHKSEDEGEGAQLLLGEATSAGSHHSAPSAVAWGPEASAVAVEGASAARVEAVSDRRGGVRRTGGDRTRGL